MIKRQTALEYILEHECLRIAIVGSRGYKNLELVGQFVGRLPTACTIISGGAYGVDQKASQSAKDAGLQTLIFPADWQKYGKAAGVIRNRDIIQNADVVIAFWDGKSNGTRNSIELAQATGKRFFVVR